MIIYVNGQWIEADAPAIAATDRGLTLGDGLFETMAVRGGDIRRVDAHLARLRASAHELGIELADDNIKLAQVLSEAAQRNGLNNGPGNGIIRLTLTRGRAGPSLASLSDTPSTLIVSASPRPPRRDPVTAIISRVTRRNEHSPLARMKTLNFLDNILAAREAETKNVAGALLLNTAGRLAEATIANLFLVINDRLITPPIDEGALPGTMRAHVIAKEPVDERPLTTADLKLASEALLTNSGAILALVSVDGVAIGDGHPGPVYQHLQNLI